MKRKLRVSRELHERIRTCADAIQEQIQEFARVAVIWYVKGKLDDVAYQPELLHATENDSVRMTIEDADCELTAEAIKEALIKAVLFAEPRNPKPFNPGMIEGRDYIVMETE